MTNYCVYKHIFPNGKVYIGLTRQSPTGRWQNGAGYKTQPLVFNAIKKYGWENIQHEVIFDNLTFGEAHEKEIEMISLHKSNDTRFGYNISSGGYPGTGHAVSEEARKRIGDSHRGKPLTPEHRSKLHKPHYGKCRGERPQEWLEHLKQAGVGRPKKSVNQYTKDGDFVREWDSILQVYNELGIAQGNIIAVCKKKRSSAGGFIWAYAIGGE